MREDGDPLCKCCNMTASCVALGGLGVQKKETQENLAGCEVETGYACLPRCTEILLGMACIPPVPKPEYKHIAKQPVLLQVPTGGLISPC